MSETGLRERWLERVRESAAGPLVRRAQGLEEIPAEWVDTRATDALGARREIFALAMSDLFTTNVLAESLPDMARAATDMADGVLLGRVMEQLEEMAGWNPLQRPGWTLFRPGEPPEPEHFDGNWLATGCGAWAVTEAVRALGDRVDTDLRARLKRLLESEIAGVWRDFTQCIPWFTKGNGNPACNQWVLPLCGVVEAATHLGTHRAAHAGAYETAVANLNRSLDVQGDEGDFVEGLSYASFTLTNLLRAALAARRCGDERLSLHPYLPRFARWLGQMLLPGGWVVNMCDCGITRVNLTEWDRTRTGLAELSALLALTTRSPHASWLLHSYLGMPPTAAGLEASEDPVEPQAPALWTHMRGLGVVAWRTGWGPEDHAVWVRTSGGLPSHTHADSCHVSVLRGGRPVLIEAGTPTYGHPDIGRSFASGAGHNLLQIGREWPEPYMTEREIRGWQKRNTPVTLRGMSLEQSGGHLELEIDPAGYEGLRRWIRTCEWDGQARTRVVDTVELAGEDHALFRFHLGGSAPSRIEGSGSTRVGVEQDGAQLVFSSDAAIVVESVEWPAADDAVGGHECLEVRTRAPVSTWRLETEVR